MENKIIKKVVEESKLLLVLIILSVVIFKIVFFKENIVTVIRIVLSLFWLFVIPGFYMMYAWVDELSMLERFVIGVIVSVGIVGIISYYLGILLLHTKYHMVVVPLLMLFVNLFLIYKKSN